MIIDKAYWTDFLLQSGSITIAAILIPVIAGLFFKRYWNRALLAVFWYYLAYFLLAMFEKLIRWTCTQYLDTCISLLDYWGIDNTHFLSILYYTKDYIFLGWFFILIFQNKKIGKIIKVITGIFIVASVINYCFFEGYKGFGVFNPSIDMIYVVSLPLIYLWYSQRESLRIPLKKNPYFWINIGILLPNLLALFRYFSGNHIFESDFKLYVILKSFENGFAILGFILVAIGFSRSRYVRFIATNENTQTEEYNSSSSP